jgi:hypothetical protein
VSPGEATIEKAPSTSLNVPFSVFLICTEAPATGTFFSSVILPLTGSWENNGRRITCEIKKISLSQLIYFLFPKLNNNTTMIF